MDEFRLLGPLEAVVDGRPVQLAAAKPRALLALLLLNRNRVVPTDRLIDELWADEPPARATKTLQVYVSQLRKELGPDRLVTQQPGYLLRVGEGELDLERFEQLTAAARKRLAEDPRDGHSPFIPEFVPATEGMRSAPVSTVVADHTSVAIARSAATAMPAPPHAAATKLPPRPVRIGSGGALRQRLMVSRYATPVLAVIFGLWLVLIAAMSGTIIWLLLHPAASITVAPALAVRAPL